MIKYFCASIKGKEEEEEEEVRLADKTEPSMTQEGSHRSSSVECNENCSETKNIL